jgi:hypothetical protein
MTTRRKVLAGGAVLAVLVAGCAAAGHLKMLDPPATPASRPLPSTAPMQLGVDIDAYTYPGQNIGAAAEQDIAYVRGLHANAVSISFPFFMSGGLANSVHASPATPSPAQLAVVVEDAQEAGLFVSIRPLLDETNLGVARTRFRPADPARWFASYLKFLRPYVAMAQRTGVSEVYVGVELSRFPKSPYWNWLDTRLRRVYYGALGYSNNWGGLHFTGSGGSSVRESVDAYRPISGSLTAGWTAFDRALPAGTVITEVGIAAVRGAYRLPYHYKWHVTRLDQSVQARWFTAACRAAAATHLGGIYFWSIGLGVQPTGPTLSNQLAWAGGQGARAISACFAALGRQAVTGRTGAQ